VILPEEVNIGLIIESRE